MRNVRELCYLRLSRVQNGVYIDCNLNRAKEFDESSQVSSFCDVK